MFTADVVIYPRKQMTAQDFALLIEQLTTNKSGIIYGCDLAKKSATEITISAGWCVVRGRVVKIEAGDYTITRPDSETETRYITLMVDLKNPDKPGIVQDYTELMEDTPDFNVENGVAYLRLGEAEVSSSGVESVASCDKMTPVYQRSGQIHVSDRAPTSVDGNDGDLWVVYS